MRAWFSIGCVMLVGLVCSTAVHAAKPVRVLLYQDALSVNVSAPSDLQARMPGGEVRVVAPSLVIKPLPRALRVNGEHVSSDRITISGDSQDLAVSATVAATAPTKAVEALPEAVFLRRPSPSKSRARSKEAGDHSAAQEFIVPGTLHIVSQGDRLAVINLLSLEDYVEGVLPSEIHTSWPMEALKAQALATRTYVLHQQMIHEDRHYDVVSTVLDQVYRGRVGVNDRVRSAVEATRSLAITYDGRPILAAFSSTAAGPTEDAVNVWSKELPYLKGVDCPFDRDSPFYEWRTSFPIEALEARLNQGGWRVGTIATLTPFEYSQAGRVVRIRILHSLGELLLRGEDLRRVVGYRVIPSTRFTVEALGREVALSGYGNGHAVGMCQWGTKELAELGYPFRAILQYYYPGTEISRSWRLDPVVRLAP